MQHWVWFGLAAVAAGSGSACGQVDRGGAPPGDATTRGGQPGMGGSGGNLGSSGPAGNSSGVGVTTAGVGGSIVIVGSGGTGGGSSTFGSMFYCPIDKLLPDEACAAAELPLSVASVAEGGAAGASGEPICAYEIPAPPAGDVFDPDKVNVYVSHPALDECRLGYVEGPEVCEMAAAGWYYDDAESPTQIVLCPQPCEVAWESDYPVVMAMGCAAWAY